MNVSIEKVHITPELAADWLGQQHINRHLRPALAKRYAQAMAAGEWEDNGETIKFNSDGTLIDGQHRLTSIRDNGLTMDLWVARGLTHTAQATIDSGAKRSVGDVFSMRGYPNAHLLAAALNVFHRYETESEARWGSSVTLQAPRALELYAANPDIQQSMVIGRKASAARRALPPGLACALHYIFTLFEEDDANEFFMRLADGVDLPAGSPILALRDLLERLDKDGQRAGRRGDKVYVHAIVVKAWNAWRAGITYTKSTPLRWSRSGRKAEPFPRPT